MCFCGSPLVSHPRVIEVENENVFRAYAHELIHYIRHLGPLHHRADPDPFRILEGRDRRCAPPGCDGGSGGEDRAADVVLTHDVFARRDYPRDARGDLVDQWPEMRILRLCGSDQDRLGLQQRRDRPQACRTHRLAGL